MCRLITLITFYLICLNYVHSGPGKCNLNRVDKCAADVFVFGNSNLTLPSSQDELTEHCKTRSTSLRCVQNYIKDCLKLFPKQVASLLVKGAANNAKQQCKLDRQEFIDRSKCLRESSEGLNRCMRKLIRQLSLAEKRTDKVALTCCLFKEYKDCSVNVLEKDQSTCSKQDVKYFISLIEGNAADVFDLVCRSRKLEPGKSKSTCIPVDEKEIRKVRRPLSLLPSYINIFSE